MKICFNSSLIVLSAAALLTTLASMSFAQERQKPDYSSREAVEQRLDSLKKEQERLANDSARSEEMQLLQQLEAELVQHREALEYLDRSREEAKSIRESIRNWKGPETPPPYSIQLAIRLRSERHAVERQLNDTDSALRIVTQLIDDTTASLTEHQVSARQLREEARATSEVVERRSTEYAAQLASLYARIDAESLAQLQLRHSALEVQQAALTSALELAGLKTKAVEGRIEFTRVELDEIQRQLAVTRKTVLSAAQLGSTGNQDRPITWKIDILDIERDFWNAAFTAFNAGNDAEKEQALGALRKLQARADDWLEIVRLKTTQSFQERAPLLFSQATVDDFRQVLELQQKIQYVRELLGDQGLSVPGLLVSLVNSFLTIWGTELYIAEETRPVAGEKVTTYSAVTLGKILRLALILVIGWILLRFFARQLRALLLRRANADTSKADLIRSWTFGIGLTLLLIYGLKVVHIPFTAFAFLGGTLAIGIGFGAQNLLKNFISGVILSLERPFKVGDLVEVDNILGYIRQIGMRASVIRHFDGTDTLVPNSTLLENRVSNWTLFDNAMRGRIEVGVAYGSSSHDVRRTLLSVAEVHGLVLDKPAPSVQFNEFGDSALKFSLLYWFDAMSVRPESISSDLHFMIDRAFIEAGIVFAFPQRDIHFDDSKPLRIEMSRPTKDAERVDKPT